MTIYQINVNVALYMTLPELPIDPSISGDIDRIDESLLQADLNQWLFGLLDDALKVDVAQKDTLTDYSVLADAMEERSMVVIQPFPDEIVPIRYYQMEGRPRGLHSATAGINRILLRFPDLIEDPARLLELPEDQDRFLDVFIQVETTAGDDHRYLYNAAGVTAYTGEGSVTDTKELPDYDGYDLFLVTKTDDAAPVLSVRTLSQMLHESQMVRQTRDL